MVFKIVKQSLKWLIYGFIAIFILLAIYKFITIKIMKKEYSNIFGYSTFEVISGSMSPSIEKYDIILVKIGANYKINDVITFKEDNSIITHRVIDIKDDIIITKGDANNTKDLPVKKDMVIGKVVNVISRGSVWINIFKTPKVLFILIVTISIASYTYKEFKKDFVLRKSDSMIAKIMNNKKLKFKIIVFILLLIILLFLIPYTFSRFKTEARGDAKIDVAFYLLNDEYQHQSINLEGFEPGMSREYNFSVANFNSNSRSEVTLDYEVVVRTTTNLPLEYKLYKIENDIALNINLEDNIETDKNGTFFKSLKTESIRFSHTANYVNYYRLQIIFPSEYKNYKYQGIPEHIEIDVNSKQVI